jgi:hypothetical protein
MEKNFNLKINIKKINSLEIIRNLKEKSLIKEKRKEEEDIEGKSMYK